MTNVGRPLDNRAAFEAHYRGHQYAPPGGYFAALLDRRIQLLRGLEKGSRILDVGCGSGAVLLPLVKEGYHVVGLDYSGPILHDLTVQAAATGVDRQSLQIVLGDACSIPFPDGSFDAVCSFATLYAVPQIEQALAEIARVLKPSGVAFLELGNTRSLNHFEARNVGTGVTSCHLSPGRMRHLLARADLGVQEELSFQIFPMWGGSTRTVREDLLPRLLDVLARPVEDTLLDQLVSSSPWLAPFAFRKLFVLKKGAHPVARIVPDAAALPAEPACRTGVRRQAVRMAAEGRIGDAADLLLSLVLEQPSDPRPVLELVRLFDGEYEHGTARRWMRIWTRLRAIPAEGFPLTRADVVPTRPAVSVILPTFNAGHLLPEAVQSLFGQTFADFELIVVDDGSEDGTDRYLSRLKDPRVQVLRQQNQRLPTALNRGTALARGGLHTWISADNVCLPTMLEQLSGALSAHPEAVLAVAGFTRVDIRLRPRGRIQDQDVSRLGFLPRNPGVAAFLYRASAAGQIGSYEPELEGAEDWDYWQRLVEVGPAILVRPVLYLYREHERSMSNTMQKMVHDASVRTFARVLERHGGGLPSLRTLYPTWDGPAALALLHLGTVLLGSRFAPPRLAVEVLALAARQDPSDVRALVQWTAALARAGDLVEALRLSRRLVVLPHPHCRALAVAVARLAGNDPTMTLAEVPVLECDALLVHEHQPMSG